MRKDENLLTLDLGNTSLSGGVWSGDSLTRSWFIRLVRGSLDRRLARFFSELKRKERISTAILASVVPDRTPTVVALCRKELGIPCAHLRDRLPSQLKILYRRPEDVGEDRLANAVGAYYTYGAPAIVVDFGTAITFDVISRRFEYLGGVIAPGLQISTEALFRRTALLPRVEIALPDNVLGKDTVSAIRSGVYFGALGLVDRVVRELKRELGWKREVRLIATGGQARLILSRSRLIRIIDPYLTLRGLRRLATIK